MEKETGRDAVIEGRPAAADRSAVEATTDNGEEE